MFLYECNRPNYLLRGGSVFLFGGGNGEKAGTHNIKSVVQRNCNLCRITVQ